MKCFAKSLKKILCSNIGLEAPIATPEVSFVNEPSKESNPSKITASKENAGGDPLPNTKGSFLSLQLAPKSGGKTVASPYITPGSKVRATPNFKKFTKKPSIKWNQLMISAKKSRQLSS
ncbi:hypothetical protein TNCT_169011 [Trichonephila clavata]|uniref:Uncharacterized protein n=1 Tax=Trichonephila clavata TaxID=2740835 RepID=A0A8X6GQ95_TRICU|nr:hypothetical protein TNCT_169011 [Trichonephila clavata]